MRVQYIYKRETESSIGTFLDMGRLGRRLRFYGKYTNLHGLRYVAEDKKHPLFRILWMVIFVLSSLGMLRIFKGSYDSFTSNAISFVTETTYLDWNTTFPALSICEIATSNAHYEPEQNKWYPALQQFISDIIFFMGSCYTCTNPCEDCRRLNYHDMVNRFRKKCPQLMKQCRWNDITFNCCDKFLPLETEYGICFTINSLHTENSRIELKSNRKTGPGELEMHTTDDVRMYIHAPEDVPFINSDPELRQDVLLGESYSVIINVIEIANDENVKTLAVEKRGCRFPWEADKELLVHKFYGYSTCIVQCHADNHFDLCNCTHHLMPVLGDKDYCNAQGLKCLTENFETVNRLHAKGFDKEGLECEQCVPSCVEPEYKIVSERKGTSENGSTINIKMQSLPTFRFKRNVVRTTLDLVVTPLIPNTRSFPYMVSIGGTAGLFIGASLLSIIETVYLLFIRNPENNI